MCGPSRADEVAGRVTGGRRKTMPTKSEVTERDSVIFNAEKVEAETAVFSSAKGVCPNRWIVLDETWAKRLGVVRTSGVYRISSRELVLRLTQPDSGAVAEAASPALAA
jgi:hypothetical protein